MMKVYLVSVPHYEDSKFYFTDEGKAREFISYEEEGLEDAAYPITEFYELELPFSEGEPITADIAVKLLRGDFHKLKPLK